MIETGTLALALAATAASAGAVRFAIHVAQRRRLLDMPNERSSHSIPRPRLGGAALIPVMLICTAVAWAHGALPIGGTITFFASALGLYLVGLIDDIVSIPVRVRFAAQFAAAGAMVFMAMAAQPWPADIALRAAVGAVFTVGVVGLLNIYNFMDGIDGIAGGQAVAGGLAWFVIATTTGANATAALAIVLSAGAAGFLIFNWPPARIFMGDAGSTVIGFLFGVLPLLVRAETASAVGLVQLAIAAILVVWPFLADGSFTILRRLRKGENIFQAHRSHLYQRLVIAGRPHRAVTIVYVGLAVIGGGLACWVVEGGAVAVVASATTTLILFAVLWGWTVWEEQRAARAARCASTGS